MSAGEWRGIESAPKDGRPILGYQATDGDHKGRTEVCHPMGAEHFYMAFNGLVPTHWMPLPDPPAGPHLK